MNYKQPLLITCKNQAEKTMAITLLYGLGYKYYNCDTLESCFEEYECDVNDTQFPHVLLDGDGEENSIDMCTRSHVVNDGITLKFTETSAIMKHLTSDIKPVVIKLNAEYEAILRPAYIKVGCQEIPYDAFNALVKAVKAYKA